MSEVIVSMRFDGPTRDIVMEVAIETLLRPQLILRLRGCHCVRKHFLDKS
jgi:hypothetical protein